MGEAEQYILDALSLIRLRGAAVRFPVRTIEDGGIIFAGDVMFRSNQLTVFLKGCREIIIMGATAGDDIMSAIEEDSSGRNVTRGVVLDATASEMVDASLDWMMAYFNRGLRRENRRLLKKRFSAGYGDFLLENQRTIFHLLELHRIGVRITENFILIPEKSVTAITGIR
ncbi:MAG: hypothetical protein FJ139_05090 [Deltaproteobacteria bacterium]|nr:hypothetical protein [Deltaproteobacteria bacterium]